MNMFDDEPTRQPMQLDVIAVDLAMVSDDNNDEFVVLRMVEASGVIFDVPMARRQAEAFGNSLAAYAS